MKKRLSPFVAGMATMALLGSLGVSALAATGAFSITVNPINIQVNGEVFQPKDATGADVPVFSYNGTTYAPLRALAEAYGLEVGYDAGSNMATVGAKASDPATTPTADTTVSDDYSAWTAEEEAAYQEFKGMWEVEDTEGTSDKYKTSKFYVYTGSLSKNSLLEHLSSLRKDRLLLFTRALVEEELINNPVLDMDILFFYDKKDYLADTVLWYANYHKGVNKPYEFSSIEWNVD